MTTTILVLLIALFGALVRTVFGFGEAMVSMPLLALIGFDLQTSTALIGALGLLVAVPATIRYRTHINKAIVGRLVAGSLVGVVLGVLLVKYVPGHIVLRLLGIFLITYGSYSLIRQWRHTAGRAHLRSNGWDYVAGLVSGTLGSAYNSHGVPIVIYGTLKKWSMNQLRGVLQAHFVCVGILVVVSQATAGFWSMTVVKLLLMLIPLLLIVIPLGNWIDAHTNPERLVRYIYGLLVIFGILMLWK